MKKNSNPKHLFAALCAAVVSASVTAGVCKIGDTEYDTLQEAFDSKTSAGADFTVTLLQDIDVTSEIKVPCFNRKMCTVDGDGHTIRQAYAGRVFNTMQGQHFRLYCKL